VQLQKEVKASGEAPWFGDNQIPANGSVGIKPSPVCVIGFYDYDDENLTVSFYENTTGTFKLVKQELTPYRVAYFDFENATGYDQDYWWKAVISDGTSEVSEIYHFTTVNSGGVPNQPPVANFNYDVNGLDLVVNSTATDSDGNVTSWYWLFGDGYSLSGPNVENTNHTYTENGTYTVTLIAFDDDNAADYITKEITIGSNGGGGTVNVGMDSQTIILVVAAAAFAAALIGVVATRKFGGR